MEEKASREKNGRFPKGFWLGLTVGVGLALLLEIVVTLIFIGLNHWPSVGYTPTWEQAAQKTLEQYSLIGLLLPLLCCGSLGALVAVGVFRLLNSKSPSS